MLHFVFLEALPLHFKAFLMKCTCRSIISGDTLFWLSVYFCAYMYFCGPFLHSSANLYLSRAWMLNHWMHLSNVGLRTDSVHLHFIYFLIKLGIIQQQKQHTPVWVKKHCAQTEFSHSLLLGSLPTCTTCRPVLKLFFALFHL